MATKKLTKQQELKIASSKANLEMLGEELCMVLEDIAYERSNILESGDEIKNCVDYNFDGDVVNMHSEEQDIYQFDSSYMSLSNSIERYNELLSSYKSTVLEIKKEILKSKKMKIKLDFGGIMLPDTFQRHILPVLKNKKNGKK